MKTLNDYRLALLTGSGVVPLLIVAMGILLLPLLWLNIRSCLNSQARREREVLQRRLNFTLGIGLIALLTGIIYSLDRLTSIAFQMSYGDARVELVWVATLNCAFPALMGCCVFLLAYVQYWGLPFIAARGTPKED